MPELHTKADSIVLVHTGADATNGTQADPAACLGGYRSVSITGEYGALIDLSPTYERLTTIRIERLICGAEPTATLTITAESTGSLSFEDGDAVEIADGETKLLEGSDDDWAVVVTRVGTADLVGGLQFTAVPVFNDAVAGPNVADADRVTGQDLYCGLMLRNENALSLTSVRLYAVYNLLGTAAITSSAQLGASGAGTIGGAASCFSDWPESGWAHVKTTGGTSREAVYYTSRTNTVLTVPAAGRGMLGTSASAGAANDVANAIPGWCAGKEAPGADGAIQTIANPETAPTGFSWTTSAFHVEIGTLTAGASYGVWFHREIPAGATVSIEQMSVLRIQFTCDGITYLRRFDSLFRLADTTIEGYELYVGEDEEPDLTAAPNATNATLPFSHGITPPVSGETEFRAVVRYRNAYDLVSPNTYSRSRTVDDNGDEVPQPPTAPTFSIETGPGGIVKILAYYNPGDDETVADTWRIYAEEGADPVPGVDTPTEVSMEADAVIGSPVFALHYDSSQYGHNVEVRVLVTAYRTSDSAESSNTTAETVTTDTRQPDIARQRAWHIGTVARQVWGPPTVDETTTYDETENVYARHYPGYTDFYVDSTLVWRLKYDSAGPAENNGLWTTLAFQQAAISGAASSTPVDVLSATE
ncbi:hypothetical protein KKH23_10000, partial [Patescibacteria group bacterium]|nr:hypothetical protein [Patescibacteria group bacterium]